MPCPKADNPRCVLGIGDVVDHIEVNGSVHGVGDSVIHFRDGNVIDLVLFALVGEIFLQEIKTGIVAKSEARLVGITVG